MYFGPFPSQHDFRRSKGFLPPLIRMLVCLQASFEKLRERNDVAERQRLLPVRLSVTYHMRFMVLPCMVQCPINKLRTGSFPP